MSSNTFIRRPEVEKITGLPTSTLYQRMREGTFPRPVKLGPKSVGWVEEEIEAWKAKRLAQRDAAAA